MELTNPINNEHMVDGLNRIISASRKLQNKCTMMISKTDDDQLAGELSAFKELHTGHIELLSDSVRYLGGSPDKSEPNRKVLEIKNPITSINELYDAERKLIEQCDGEIKHLAGSAEVAEKLTRVKDEVSKLLAELQ